VNNPIGPANTAGRVVANTVGGWFAFIDGPVIGDFNMIGFFTATIKSTSVAIPISMGTSALPHLP
jgi:hypothetical protein